MSQQDTFLAFKHANGHYSFGSHPMHRKGAPATAVYLSPEVPFGKMAPQHIALEKHACGCSNHDGKMLPPRERKQVSRGSIFRREAGTEPSVPLEMQTGLSGALASSLMSLLGERMPPSPDAPPHPSLMSLLGHPGMNQEDPIVATAKPGYHIIRGGVVKKPESDDEGDDDSVFLFGHPSEQDIPVTSFDLETYARQEEGCGQRPRSYDSDLKELVDMYEVLGEKIAALKNYTAL